MGCVCNKWIGDEEEILEMEIDENDWLVFWVVWGEIVVCCYDFELVFFCLCWFGIVLYGFMICNFCVLIVCIFCVFDWVERKR